MARRKSQKLKPAERSMEFIIEEAGIYYLDLANSLSRINRAAYRQGYDYAVERIELFSTSNTSTDSSSITIERLPAGWVTANAWVKAFKAWQKQQRDAMDDTGGESLLGKYNDFKIYMDSVHPEVAVPFLTPNGFATLATAQITDPTAVADWDYSQFVLPQVDGITDEYFGHIVGPDTATSKGLIHNYALSRSRPQAHDPNVVGIVGESTGLYGDMEDVGHDMDEIMDNVQYRNNTPPYIVGDRSNFEWYPGGADDGGLTWVDTLLVRGGATLSTDATGGFTALCGLIKMVADGPAVIKVTMMPGLYKGVMARPLQEVN